MEQLVVLTHSLSDSFPIQYQYYCSHSHSLSFLTFSPHHIIPLHPLKLACKLQSSHIPLFLCTPFMDGLQFEPKMRSEKVVVKREAIAHYVVDEQNGYLEEDKKNKEVVACVGKKESSGGGSGSMRCCQAEKCKADLNDAKQYHWKHKVCEYHAKAQVVLVVGKRQRFCQQCSRFHELAEFDDTKRSCRRRLAGHNERRRKNSESQAEGSSRKGTGPHLKDIACGQVDDRGRIQMTIQENAACKHFQIR